MKTILTGLTVVLFIGVVASCRQPPAKEDAAAAESRWMEKGQELATAAFTALSGELRAALGRGGVPEAIQYCHVAALPITDSIAAGYDATIRRTTLKPRNPANAPRGHETDVLAGYQAASDQGQALQPQVHVEGNQVHFYAPIMTQDMCLKCHGNPGETIAEKDWALIQERYPNDLAHGYGAGEWRGMWSIAFEKERD
jgi:hypothetical protein